MACLFCKRPLVWLISLWFAHQGMAQVWTSIGPMPLTPSPQDAQEFFTGRVRSAAVDPTDSTHWLMGTASGGVWESHDSGTSWVPKTDSQPSLATGAVAFAPSDPNTIYVGTGEAGFGNWQKAGLGVLKSTDGGETWTLLGNSIFAHASISWLRVHPTNPNVVLVATTRGFVGRNDNTSGFAPTSQQFGIYRSTDGGATWVKTLAGEATALEADPSNFDNQYAAIGDPYIPQIAPYLPAMDNGVYRSTDGGQTWTVVSGAWSKMAATTGYIALAVAPSNPATVYASIQQPASNAYGPGVQPLLGLFRTDDAWDPAPQWTLVPTGSVSANPYSGYCSQCAYAHVISVDPSDPDTLFAGGLNLWRCGNCSDSPSWVNVEMNSDHHSLIWVGSRLIDGNDQGLYSTTDLGTTWTNHNATVNAIQFYSGALHPTDSEFILGGTQDNLAVGWYGGVYWERFPNGLGGFCEGEVAVSSSHPDTDWMCAYTEVRIARTTDGLQSWANADSGIDFTNAVLPLPVNKCPSKDDTFVAGTNRLWRTDNFFSATAPLWTANGPVAPGPVAVGTTASITAIAFEPSDSTCNTYAYGTAGGLVSLTTDGGKSWSDLDPGQLLPSRSVATLAFDPASPNILYAGFSGFNAGTPAQPGHLFKTANTLATAPAWSDISPADDEPFDVVAIDPSNSKSIYVGTDSGLWHSTDGAVTWQRQGPDTGIPNVPVYDIEINPATNRTVVFTYGRGAYALGLNPADLPPLLIGGPSSPANGATYIVGGLVPGSWAQVLGTNLSSVTRIWSPSDFVGLGNQLPTTLSGVQVQVNGAAAAVYYISPNQISFQVPNGIAGTAMVQVLRDGAPSNTITATAVSSSPGIFPVIVDGANYAAAVFLDGNLAGDPSIGPGFRNARREMSCNSLRRAWRPRPRTRRSASRV